MYFRWLLQNTVTKAPCTGCYGPRPERVIDVLQWKAVTREPKRGSRKHCPDGAMYLVVPPNQKGHELLKWRSSWLENCSRELVLVLTTGLDNQTAETVGRLRLVQTPVLDRLGLALTVMLGEGKTHDAWAGPGPSVGKDCSKACADPGPIAR